MSIMNYDQSLKPHNCVFSEAWDRNQLNPTCTRRISLLSTPQPQVDNNDILLMMGFNYNM